MTTPAVSRIRGLILVGSRYISFLGSLAAFILLAAIVFMPLGQLIFDYWTPKVQGVWQPAASGVKVTRGGR